MTAGTEDDEPCGVCGQSRLWHSRTRTQHPYTPKGLGAGDLNRTERRKVVETAANGDLALRIALIQAGVITPEALMDAEEKIVRARDNGGVLVIEAHPATPDHDKAAGSASAHDRAGVRADLRPRDGVGARGGVWDLDPGLRRLQGGSSDEPSR